MSRPYPEKQLVIDVLTDAAAVAATESVSQHPEDLAAAMLTAIEQGAVVVEILWKRGVL